MRICITGDSIMLTPPETSYTGYHELRKIIEQADVRGTNLEMVISDGNPFASTYCGGIWLKAPSARLDDLSKYGFEYYGFANNHTMDYSYDGLRDTLKELEKRGFHTSGAGLGLEEANRPAVMSKNGERVAIISCTASCDDAARAGYASPTVSARPGVNMLRHSEEFMVTPEHLKVIDEIASATCLNARFLKAVRMGIHRLPHEIHRLGRLQFVEGFEDRKNSQCNKMDLERILKNIRESVKNHDYAIVCIHSHVIKGETDDTPDYYLEEFAHKCIDAGATAVIGTGTHQLKAIELYKGRPIFYSLGNFIFADEELLAAPYDYYERYGYEVSQSLKEIKMSCTKNGTVGLEYDFMNFQSIIPMISVLDQKVEICCYPIELNFNENKGIKGFPNLAGEKVGKEIFNRLKGLSSVYGTRMEIQDGKIVVY